MKTDEEKTVISEESTETTAAPTPDAEETAAKPKRKGLFRRFGKKTKDGVDSFFTDFKKFISKGNIMDLAVAIVVGGAFTAIVNSLVGDIIMPLIGTLVPKSALDWLVWHITGDIVVNGGKFITAIINFIVIAFVIFMILRIMVRTQRGAERFKEKQLKKLEKKRRKGIEIKPEDIPEPPAPPAPIENELDILRDIRALLMSLDQKNNENVADATTKEPDNK